MRALAGKSAGHPDPATLGIFGGLGPRVNHGGHDNGSGGVTFAVSEYSRFDPKVCTG